MTRVMPTPCASNPANKLPLPSWCLPIALVEEDGDGGELPLTENGFYVGIREK